MTIKEQQIQRHNSQVIQSYNSILQNVQKNPAFVFMNHGYAPTNIEIQENDLPWKHQISLYNSLFVSANDLGMSLDLSNKSILEVGCGRGGGLSFISRYYQPKKAVGIDLNPNQIEFCQQVHKLNGLTFNVADACNLPFEPNTFDVVVNVESAHLYSEPLKFYEQVNQVLNSNGYFLYTDIYSKNSELYQKLLHRDKNTLKGFEILFAQDITQNVIAACEQDKTFFKDYFSSPEMAFLAAFSEEKEYLYRKGDIKYLSIVAKKITQ